MSAIEKYDFSIIYDFQDNNSSLPCPSLEEKWRPFRLLLPQLLSSIWRCGVFADRALDVWDDLLKHFVWDFSPITTSLEITFYANR